MAFDIPLTSNMRSFEECSQLVNLIRYQLGDPHELINNFCFRGGSAFALLERQKAVCEDENDYYRHTVNFAWVMLETFFTGGVPEMKSPVFYLNGCHRRWQFVANFMRGSETIADEVDVYLQCLECQDTSIRADVKMDLQRGTDKIGEDATSHVYFDSMVEKHVVFTGARKRTVADDADDADSLSDAFTVQGSFNFKDCCEDRRPDEEPDFQTSFYA